VLVRGESIVKAVLLGWGNVAKESIVAKGSMAEESRSVQRGSWRFEGAY